MELGAVLAALEVPPRSYRRWKQQLEEGVAAPRSRGRPPGAPPTPEEVLAVRRFALRHPTTGYKRLAWWMVAKGVAYLRPYQVREILRQANLLAPRVRPAADPLKRPAPPQRPDEVWHLDLMYVRIGERWFYLVDILDGYSRYLVHWSLNPTMRAETVTLTVQEALEKLEGERPAGEPALVHDHGSQFVSAEWKGFVSAVGSRDIRTRVAHPESNGKVERLHRTHREEGLAGAELEDYHAGLRALARWTEYYNTERPHSALKYLPPVVYYRGDPEAKLREREARLAAKAATRAAYWEGRPP
jgi:transposase InsO family protein